MGDLSKSEYVVHNEESTLSGYLYKKTRDDRWQKRWFETNGVYLTYYKSKKMEKLLAALSLPQVGEIKQIADEGTDKQSGLFTLELNSRIYTLRAKTDEEAAVWVATLIKLRADGINATQQPKVADTKTSQQKSIQQSPEVEGDNADWMKSGKSFCGCC